ncbi:MULTISPECIES: hypothetical protein [unclassified Pseudoalteromonas]|uniref:hypothetical protein n=1 Tax=unclassified Pseudoalteromonas TaxID=194690 RepID=UPI00386D5F74
MLVKKQNNTPMNVRYNNPLNIRTGNDWVGERERAIDKGYEEFLTPAFGFRAAYKLLMTYKNKYSAYTLETILNRWAPANGEHNGQTYVNHTQNYIKYVGQRLGITAHDAIPEHLYPELMLAMSDFEGAKGAFNLHQAREGVTLA